MKELIEELIVNIILIISVIMIRFEIYPQYHELCMSTIVIISVVDLVYTIKKIIRYRREKESL